MSSIIQNLQPDPEEILRYLELSNLDEEDKQEVLIGLIDHFNEIITETMIQKLSIEQSGALSAALDLPSPQREEKIADIASAIPGLHAEIEKAVMDELGIIKNAYQKV